MRCPSCDAFNSGVIDSRTSGDMIRRRRRCTECQHRFTTFEVALPESMLNEVTQLGELTHRTPPNGVAQLLELINLFGEMPAEDVRLLIAMAHRMRGEAIPRQLLIGRAA